MSMRIQLTLILSFLCVASAHSTKAGESTLPGPAERIIVLNPALVEIGYALGLGPSIVGVVEFSDFPEEAKKLPRVGSYLQPQIEKIVSLNPTLVVALREGVDSISEPLQRAKIHARIFTSRKIADIPQVTEDFCRALKHPKPCEKKRVEFLSSWNSSWSKIRSPKHSRQVVIQVDHEPLVVAGGDTYLSEILQRCGHANTFGHLNGYPRPSLESLQELKTDHVVVLGQLSKGVTETQIRDFWSRQSRGSTQIHFLQADELSRLGPRLPSAAQRLCEALQ